MTHVYESKHADGVGESWTSEVFRHATRAREAAESGQGATWLHLLIEATTAVASSADETALGANLMKLTHVTKAWRTDLARRRGDVRCLSTCCNPDAAGFHNSTLTLNQEGTMKQ